MTAFDSRLEVADGSRASTVDQVQAPEGTVDRRQCAAGPDTLRLCLGTGQELTGAVQVLAQQRDLGAPHQCVRQ